MKEVPFNMTLGDGIVVDYLPEDGCLEISPQNPSQPRNSVRIGPADQSIALRLSFSADDGDLHLISGSPSVAIISIQCKADEAKMLAKNLGLYLDDADA